MKFVGHEDVEAPIAFVFEQMTDFPTLERSALRRGAEVQRVDDGVDREPGMRWDVAFKFRGKRRELLLELAEIDAPNGIVVTAGSSNLSGGFNADLVALSRSRTRITVQIDMVPKTLAGRLMVQSMKLARSTLTRRFKKRLAEYAVDLEDRFKALA